MVNGTVIFFDGVCNLCSSSVQFVIKRDTKQVFQFASLQSEAGQNAIAQSGLQAKQLESVVLLENNKWYTQSTAALRIARKLNGAWPLMYAFIIVPPFLRNAIYNFIARNRYKWFGKNETCWLPLPQWKSRFLT